MYYNTDECAYTLIYMPVLLRSDITQFENSHEILSQQTLMHARNFSGPTGNLMRIDFQSSVQRETGQVLWQEQ